MPIWVMLYLVVMAISIPMGVSMLRRLEQDWLHPVGGLLSTLLSMAFVLSYWLPDAVPFHSGSTVFLFGFVVFWDGYAMLRLKTRMPELFHLLDDETPPSMNSAIWLGVILMLPAYFFAALVCFRSVS